MRITEIRALSDEEISKEVENTYRELLSLRFRASTRQLANVKEVSVAKKKLARLSTVIRERELGA